MQHRRLLWFVSEISEVRHTGNVQITVPLSVQNREIHHPMRRNELPLQQLILIKIIMPNAMVASWIGAKLGGVPVRKQNIDRTITFDVKHRHSSEPPTGVFFDQHFLIHCTTWT